MNQMNTFLRSFCEAFNSIERTGVDADGNDMGSVFVAQNKALGTEYDMSDALNETDANGNVSERHLLLRQIITIN